MEIYGTHFGKKAQDGRGGQWIRTSSYPQRSEEALALIGFGLGRRWELDHHDSKIDIEAGGSIESAPPWQDLHPFRSSGKGSILLQMLQLSKDWHSQRDQGTVTKSLRQHMFQSVFEELATKASKLPFGSNEHELIQALQTKQILTSTNGWNYMQRDPNAKTLKAAARDPFSLEETSTLIQKIHKLAAQSDLIYRVSALKPIPQDQISKDSIVVVPWRLDISLRGPVAQELHESLMKLTGSGLIQLILVRIRPLIFQSFPLARAIASRLRRLAEL